MEPIVVDTPRGRVRGRLERGAAVFRGLPYARAPFGPLRLLAPEPVPAWDGVRDALELGATAPKPPYPKPFDRLIEEPVIEGEECLNLNVWTPDPAAGGLPVLVWIHGGSFRNGSNAARLYDGGAFARDGVVLVAINYRLGADGFALWEDAVPNRGLLDQVAALEWVQESIAAFGGDPGRVTICGESAGAMSVAMLLGMPRARGLFARAIAQSGAAHHAQPRASARRVAVELARRLGAVPTREAIAAVGLDRLIAAQHQLGQEVAGPARDAWGALGLDLMAFEPVIDGDVLPAAPLESIRGGGATVPVLAGANAQEYRWWLVPLGRLQAAGDADVAAAAARYGLPASRLRAYDDGALPGARLDALITDWFFRIPAIRLAEARAAAPAPTYLYELAWGGTELGAAHVVDIPFVFDNLGVETAAPLVGRDPPQPLADAMHAAWVAFASGGDPGWPAYTPGRRAVMTFGVPCEVVEDPHAERRRAWEGVR